MSVNQTRRGDSCAGLKKMPGLRAFTGTWLCMQQTSVDGGQHAGHHGYPQPYRTLFALSSSIVFLQRNSDIANKACQLRKKNLNNKVAERSSIQRFITLAFALLATS